MDHATPKLDPAFTSALKRIIHERTAHCPRCGYDLCGIPGPRCPECGKNVAYHLRVADTTPHRLPEMRRKALIRLVLRWLGIAALVPVIAAITWLLWRLWFT